MDLEYFIQKLEKYDPDVKSRLLNIFQWGSRVYETNNPNSDWDFVAVVTKSYPSVTPHETVHKSDDHSDEPNWSYEIYVDPEINVTFLDTQKFRRMVIEHRLEALECLFLPAHNVWQHSFPIHLQLDRDVLRRATNWEVNRTWAKAKRRISSGDMKKGKKELFHALRYLTFALQILEEGRINNYQSANKYWQEIKAMEDTSWSVYNSKYEGIYEELKSRFNKPILNSYFYTKRECRLLNFEKRPERQQKSHGIESNLSDSHCLCSEKLYTVKFLREHGKDLLPIRIVETHEFNKNLLYLGSYNQYQANADPLLSYECHGLIVDQEKNFEVVALPYFTFYNYWQPEAKQLDVSSVQIYEKLDGHLAILYHYNNKWHIASSRRPDGLELLCFKNSYCIRAFASMFWYIWKELDYQLPTQTNKTFIFELLTNRHRWAVNNPKDRIVLTGVRDLETLIEESPNIFADKYGWECIKPLDIKFESFEQIVTASSKLNPFVNEGFVLCDKNYFRVKIKSKEHVALSYLGFNNGTSMCITFLTFQAHMYLGMPSLEAEEVDIRSMLEFVRNGEDEEFCGYFPQWKELQKDIRTKFLKLKEELTKTFDEFKDLPNRTEFGIATSNHPLQNAMIKIYTGQFKSVEDFLFRSHYEQLIKKFTYYDIVVE